MARIFLNRLFPYIRTRTQKYILQKSTNIVLFCDFTIPLSSPHFRSSPTRSIFIPRASSTSLVSLLDANRRRGYFSMEDSTSIRYIPREYITGLPSNTHTHTRMHYIHWPPLDGYIRDCDLRYRKLLSKARPKTRSGCIKFLNSDITATCRRCLPSLLQTRSRTKIPLNYLLNKQIIFRKIHKMDFIHGQARKETMFRVDKSRFLQVS